MHRCLIYLRVHDCPFSSLFLLVFGTPACCVQSIVFLRLGSSLAVLWSGVAAMFQLRKQDGAEYLKYTDVAAIFLYGLLIIGAGTFFLVMYYRHKARKARAQSIEAVDLKKVVDRVLNVEESLFGFHEQLSGEYQQRMEKLLSKCVPPNFVVVTKAKKSTASSRPNSQPPSPSISQDVLRLYQTTYDSSRNKSTEAPSPIVMSLFPPPLQLAMPSHGEEKKSDDHHPATRFAPPPYIFNDPQEAEKYIRMHASGMIKASPLASPAQKAATTDRRKKKKEKESPFSMPRPILLPSWTKDDTRKSWRKHLLGAKRPYSLALRLLELEEVIPTNALSAKFLKNRDAWVHATYHGGRTTLQELLQTLVQEATTEMEIHRDRFPPATIDDVKQAQLALQNPVPEHGDIHLAVYTDKENALTLADVTLAANCLLVSLRLPVAEMNLKYPSQYLLCNTLDVLSLV